MSLPVVGAPDGAVAGAVAPSRAVQRRARWDTRARPAHRVALVLVLLGLWEAVVRVGLADERFVSPPSRIAPAAVDLLQDPPVRAALSETATSVVLAFVLAAVVGLALGTFLGLNRLAHQALRPIADLLFATPKMVLIPVYILLFGLEGRAVYLFGFSLAVFPILLTTTTAVRSVDPNLLVAARSMGASPLALFRRVLVPAALPDLMTGLRVGLVQALLGVLLAELYGAVSGVGYFASLFSQSFQTDATFALFALVSTVAVAVNVGFAAVERRSGRWRQGRAA